jgi:hypothetical protein
MDKTTIAIIGGALVVGAGAVWWLSRRKEPALPMTRYQSIDRSEASGYTSPIAYEPPPTVFETLADNAVAAGPPPPPPPPTAGCGDGYYYTDQAFMSADGWWSGGCLQIPEPVPPVQTVAPPQKSCGTFDVVCKAKRAASSVAHAVAGGPKGLVTGFVDLNKAYVGYSVDQFKKGAAYTGAEGKAKAFISGQTRGAA